MYGTHTTRRNSKPTAHVKCPLVQRCYDRTHVLTVNVSLPYFTPCFHYAAVNLSALSPFIYVTRVFVFWGDRTGACRVLVRRREGTWKT